MKRDADVAGIVAVGLLLIVVALTLAQVGVDHWAAELPFVAGFLTLLGAWCLHRRDASARWLRRGSLVRG
jgi:hypothetical protein